jgi:hypothetical protein
MADLLSPQVSLTEHREFYLNPQTGRTHVRMPAGGAGGGVTSYADVPATEEQHVEFLKRQLDVKKAEVDMLSQTHGEADQKLKEKKAQQHKDQPRPLVEDDGPTIQEWVASGRKARDYPSAGLASKSTPEEVSAAVAAEAHADGESWAKESAAQHAAV